MLGGWNVFSDKTMRNTRKIAHVGNRVGAKDVPAQLFGVSLADEDSAIKRRVAFSNFAGRVVVVTDLISCV